MLQTAGLPLGGRVVKVNGVDVDSKAAIVVQLKTAGAGPIAFTCRLPTAPAQPAAPAPSGQGSAAHRDGGVAAEEGVPPVEPEPEPGPGPGPGRSLSFTRYSVELTPSTTDVLHDTVTKKTGNLLINDNKGAGCTEYVMRTGQHYAEFKMLNLHKNRFFCMVGRPTADVEAGFSKDVWGVLKSGRYVHGELGSTGNPEKIAQDWPPDQDQRRKDAIVQGHSNTVFLRGDRLGMLVDCDRGVLAIYKNGKLLGIASRELPSNEPLCFGIGLRAKEDSVQILTPEMPAVLPESLRGKLPGSVEPDEQLQVEPEPPHTFGNSNFKRAKGNLVPITLSVQVFTKLYEFLFTFCQVHGLTAEAEMECMMRFHQRLSTETANHDKVDVMGEVGATAELLWTSALRFDGMGTHTKELCSLLNAAIRDDHPDLAVAVVAMVSAVNTLCVVRRTDAPARRFPTGGITYRGAGFGDDPQLKDFFTEGKHYRVPGFLATSFDENVAREFLFRAAENSPEQIMWVVYVDPEGETVPARRCMHVNYVENSHIKNSDGTPREAEYLFAPYSIFTVRSVTWGADGVPHRVELDAASDNRAEAEGGQGRWATPPHSEDLPLAPWY